ncbi:MAG: tyrosine-type recombinase/integrase [Pirellulaceae bacterium]
MLFIAAGDDAAKRFVEFFTANIRNPHTREAYYRAACYFSAWCEHRDLALADIQPVHVAAYIETLSKTVNQQTRKVYGKVTVKQHLAAIRMLFDWLVVGQVVPFNPASAVRGPKHTQDIGKTPHLEADEVRQLIDAVDSKTIGGLRDRALIGLMMHTFARVTAALAMDVGDYYRVGAKRWFFRLKEKGSKTLDIPAHHLAQQYMDAYLTARRINVEDPAAVTTPLFCSLDRHRRLTSRRLDRREALAMIKRRAKAAGLSNKICNHTSRATGITNFLLNGGSLEDAQRIAGHASAKTTKGYDHSDKALTQTEIERIDYFRIGCRR